MPPRPRPRFPRVSIPGARIQFANTVAELVNLSPTGSLIRMNFELRKGGEWPLVIELPEGEQVWLKGRVVRCRPYEGAFILALSFVSPTAQAQTMLNDICQAPAPGPAKEKRPRPLPWRLPRFSVERLLRMHWSTSRQCPECHSGEVSKERSHGYSCLQCGRRFSGYRIGRMRISL